MTKNSFLRLPGLPMSFFDEASIRREPGLFGEVEVTALDEPSGSGVALPFFYVTCQAV